MTSRDRDRTQLFTRRAALFAGGKAVLFSALLGRLYYLQIIESDKYQTLAEENRISLRLILPQRGRILDRYGREIASNRLKYRVILTPEQTSDVDRTLQELERVIPLGDAQRERILDAVARQRGFLPVTVSEDLSWEEFSRVNVLGPELPGIQTDAGKTRFYPYREAAAHVVGYVGAVTEEEMTNEPLLRLPGFKIGKTGVESVLDKKLRGRAGHSQLEVNATGRVIRELSRREGVTGDDVVLTLDAELQKYASERLKTESAAAVVMDVFSGDILVLASTPGFDPNAFNLGISNKNWQALLDNPRTPLVNKPLAGQYPPGSTFKMMVLLAALENQVIGPEHQVYCPGSMRFGDSVFHCWKRRGHGYVDGHRAIVESCDLYFYDVARRTGLEHITDMARRFGFGEKLRIGLPEEKAGLIPTRAWKRETFGVPWQGGETLITGIGQGFVLATPLQLAVMTARLANGGLATMPRLMREPAASRPEAAPKALGISPSSLEYVQAAMIDVVASPRGTAYRSRIKEKGLDMAGKTGTSQVKRISRAERESELIKNKDKLWLDRDHALFVGYGPVAEPRYAVAVVIEHGGGGSTAAAPVARDLLRETLVKDPSNQAPLQTPAAARSAQLTAGVIGST